MVCMVSGVRFRKLIHACYIHWCLIVEVVVDMLRVPSLWLLLGRVRIVLIRIMYVSVSRCLSLFAAAISACVLCVCSS